MVGSVEATVEGSSENRPSCDGCSKNQGRACVQLCSRTVRKNLNRPARFPLVCDQTYKHEPSVNREVAGRYRKITTVRLSELSLDIFKPGGLQKSDPN